MNIVLVPDSVNKGYDQCGVAERRCVCYAQVRGELPFACACDDEGWDK